MAIEAAEKPESCFECDRLFEEYADSINTHLEAVRGSHSAAEGQNRAALAESERLENQALQKRQNLRRTLMEHEVNHLIYDLRMRQQISD